jgi:hypothetical protein
MSSNEQNNYLPESERKRLANLRQQEAGLFKDEFTASMERDYRIDPFVAMALIRAEGISGKRGRTSSERTAWLRPVGLVLASILLALFLLWTVFQLRSLRRLGEQIESLDGRVAELEEGPASRPRVVTPSAESLTPQEPSAAPDLNIQFEPAVMTATIGGAAQPLVIQVRDANGQPLVNQSITVAVTGSGSGQVNQPSGVTDGEGRFQTQYQPGNQAGEVTLEVRVGEEERSYTVQQEPAPYAQLTLQFPNLSAEPNTSTTLKVGQRFPLDGKVVFAGTAPASAASLLCTFNPPGIVGFGANGSEMELRRDWPEISSDPVDVSMDLTALLTPPYRGGEAQLDCTLTATNQKQPFRRWWPLKVEAVTYDFQSDAPGWNAETSRTVAVNTDTNFTFTMAGFAPAVTNDLLSVTIEFSPPEVAQSDFSLNQERVEAGTFVYEMTEPVQFSQAGNVELVASIEDRELYKVSFTVGNASAGASSSSTASRQVGQVLQVAHLYPQSGSAADSPFLYQLPVGTPIELLDAQEAGRREVAVTVWIPSEFVQIGEDPVTLTITDAGTNSEFRVGETPDDDLNQVATDDTRINEPTTLRGEIINSSTNPDWWQVRFVGWMSSDSVGEN